MKVLDPRKFGLICAVAALATGLSVAGCAEQVPGSATPNAAELSAYKTEAASSSAAATSSRRAAERAQAISDNCDPFPATTGIGVTKYNEFVDAHDNNAPDYVPKRDAAADTLEDAANKVESVVNSTRAEIPPDLADKLTEYVNAARELAKQTRGMTYTAPVGPLNDASKRVNDARNAVRDACGAR
ncbi:hypothetical protein [Nocardia donostiensis]|uniref:Lipoprotein n=1 Tax=Nocardia donostiensis TaxID=1538463 RepID=A0A1W0BLE7_9NOCA|nr:hypothetical protein [Nocardia donostiensis]ONM48635.1 hypothetical protein B0T46_11365 [Nocardia donostiensis]OQS16824.1 hypothetical protein B0T36_04040 [Nocardia donostiensis]OQS23289.1 hypothetical protein B0T44_03365 [Nocardia donostiensis]